MLLFHLIFTNNDIATLNHYSYSIKIGKKNSNFIVINSFLTKYIDYNLEIMV